MFTRRPCTGRSESEVLLNELAEEGDSSNVDGHDKGTGTRDDEIFGVFGTNGGCKLL